ncbi:MAG: DUF4097 family beta strand repeat-containing protein [Ruminococcus sp.]|nr:DUF4097 family beta strand repeat-containing protein [Ruminococcus sp.]
MNVQEYRNRLINALEGCLPDEIESAVEYYTELIEESEDPDEQMEKLGSPEELAERIKRESGWIQPAEGISADDGQAPPPQGFGAQNYGAQQAYQQQTSNGGAVAGRVIALILTFPFWIAVFSVLISLFFVIWGVYIAFPCGALSAFAAGIMEMKTYAGYGMLILFCSILFAGIAVLLANPAANLTRLTAHGTASFARFLFAPSAKGGKFEWKKTGRAALAAGIGLVIVGLFAGGAVFGIVRPTPEKYGEHLGLETKEYDLTADHRSITANIDFGSVTVKKAQDGKASLKAMNVEAKYLTVSDKTALLINYKRADKNYFNFDLFGMKSMNTADTKFEIYLPDKEYDAVKIEADLGKIDISDLTADTIELGADCGAIRTGNITAVNFTIEESLGKVTLNDVTANDLDVINNCGAVKMKNVTVSGKMTADLDCGAAKIDDTKAAEVIAKCDCGDFKYDGEITGSGDIQVDVGAVDMKLSGQDYNVSADSDTGNVKVDDTLKGGSIRIDVHDDCGNVNVKAA